jgi:hypothetical protein
MKTIGILILALLTGCTMYDVKRTAPDGSSVEVSVRSTRSFEQPQLSYRRRGSLEAEFNFGAANATDSTSVIWQALINGTLQVVPRVPGTPTPMPTQ